MFSKKAQLADFVLASASPRRSELLRQIGCRFKIHPVDIDESPIPGESAEQYVTRLAIEKACQGLAEINDKLPVLASDTAVVFQGRIYGKPQNEQDAVETLLALSGQRHSVMTGLAMTNGEKTRVKMVETVVEFRELTETECRRYWHTGEPLDKAGSYGIQGLAAVFVSRIEGSYSNVVGLPLAETKELLEDFGLSYWHAIESEQNRE